MNTVLRLSEHIAVPFHVRLFWLTNSSGRKQVNYTSILHFSIDCILVLICRNKSRFATRTDKPLALQRMSGGLTLKVGYCNRFWSMAGHSSWALQISQLWASLLSLWPLFLLCPLSHSCPKLITPALPPYILFGLKLVQNPSAFSV